MLARACEAMLLVGLARVRATTGCAYSCPVSLPTVLSPCPPGAAPDGRATLTPEQRAAVEHPPDGPALWLVAGAGTGKTTTLAARLAALVQQGVDPQRILLLSFSRRAAAEMARRAGRWLHAAAGLPASTPAPALPWCGTFHSVAARLLREHAAALGLPEGFSVLDRADATDLLALARQQLGLAASAQRFPLAARCAEIASAVINRHRPLAELLETDFPWVAQHEAALRRLFAAHAEAKLAQHALDFDDLLLAWWHLMQHPALAARQRARFDQVLVDEVQDLNRLQLDIVRALKPDGRGLFAVGDDAQAIYGFRGAEPDAMLDEPARFSPPARVALLQQSHRCTPPLLAASNAVIALAPRRHAKTLWSAREAGAPPVLAAVADEAAMAEGVADAVLLQRESGLALRRQAVLFRTAHHSQLLELALLRRGIPFVKYGGLRFIESAHVKDVLAPLRWADNPAARLAALRCARLLPGLGPASLQKLADGLAATYGERPETFAPPRAAAAPWAALCTLLQRLRTGPDWPGDLQRAIAWYRPHLQRLHADAAAREADLAQLQRVAGGHADRRRFVTELTLDPPEASGDEAGPPHLDDDYLVLSTIHSAKGQEWSQVHVLNVVDGCLPSDMATGHAAQIEEERRLLYVAMTRARDGLTLWVPQRFHVTEQRHLGGRHLYAPRSRFVPDALLPLFELQDPAPPDEAPQPATHVEAAAPAGHWALREAPLLDLAACLRRSWDEDDVRA